MRAGEDRGQDLDSISSTQGKEEKKRRREPEQQMDEHSTHGPVTQRQTGWTLIREETGKAFFFR